MALQHWSDPDRLVTTPSKPESTSVASTQSCGWFGNDRFVIAQVTAAYKAESSIGQTLVLLVLRKPSNVWQLLAASRDPISNADFWQQAPFRTSSLVITGSESAPSPPATLVAPGDGGFPSPRPGERFGTFDWESSPSRDIVTHIIEFAYEVTHGSSSSSPTGLRTPAIRFPPVSCGARESCGSGGCGLSAKAVTSQCQLPADSLTRPASPEQPSALDTYISNGYNRHCSLSDLYANSADVVGVPGARVAVNGEWSAASAFLR